MVDIINGIILGIIEGLTEFAPVSSTGHMILVADLLGIQEDPRINTFEVVVQLGAILAVANVFWNRIYSLLFTRRVNILRSDFHQNFNWLHILVGMIPACIVGGLFSSTIKEHLFNTRGVLIALILGGILLVIADIFRPKNPSSDTLDSVTYKQAFLVGVFQVLALWPGFSRSGSTIAAGVLGGMSYTVAAEYTFLLAMPMMVAASAKDLFSNVAILTTQDLPLFIVGLIAAYLSSYFVVKFFMRLISRVKLIPFAIYRFILAILFFLLVVK